MRKALSNVNDIIYDKYDNKRLSSHSSPNGITSWPNMHSIMQELHVRIAVLFVSTYCM